MNSKLTVVATISAAVGAVVSWAITADVYDQRVKEANDVAADYERWLRQSEDANYKLMNDERPVVNHVTVVNPAISPDEIGAQIKQQLDAVGTKTSAEKIAELQKEHADEPVELVYDRVDGKIVEVEYHGEDPSLMPAVAHALRDGVEIVTPIEEVDGESVIPPGETPEETQTNLQNIIDQYTSREDAEVFETQVLDAASSSDAAPFVITQGQFAAFDDEEGQEYTKIQITYYPNSRLLLDEDEEPIDNPAVVVGWRNLQRFGDDSGDVDTVFIRNRKLRTDFEVVRDLENKPPLHTQYGMGKEEFATRRAAGLIRLRDEDNDS